MIGTRRSAHTQLQLFEFARFSFYMEFHLVIVFPAVHRTRWMCICLGLDHVSW